MELYGVEHTKNDVIRLILIDEVLEDNIYKVQLGLSLSALGVKPEIAFSEFFENMEKLASIQDEMDGQLAQEIASMKVLSEINRFSEKLNQLL